MNREVIDPFEQETAQRACTALGVEWTETIYVFMAANMIEWADLEEFHEGHDPEDPDGEYPILGAREMIEVLKGKAKNVKMARGLVLVGITDRADEEWSRYVVIDIRENGNV